ETGVPELAVPLEPRRLLLQAVRAELARPHAPHLLRGDEPGLLQDPDVLLDTRERHVEPRGEVRDRSVSTSELLEDAASGRIRKRGERSIEALTAILNHLAQY